MESPIDVIVGNYYDVPTINAFGINEVPVLLPAHTDTDEFCLFNAAMHYHIDFRFIELDQVNGYNGHFSHGHELKLHKMKALKTFTESMIEVKQSSFFFINRWYRKYSKLTLAANRICPHNNTKVVKTLINH